MNSTEEPYVDPGPRSGPPDSLVLDIGGEIGALILYVEESLLGVELDITQEGQSQDHGVHTAVRRLRVTDRDVICAVYPQLREGDYVVWGIDHQPLARVHIQGGRVSELSVADGHSGGRGTT